MNRTEKNFIDQTGDMMAIYQLRRDVPELGFI